MHIGYHKTGTTSIQFALSRNRDGLLDHGYLYPKSGEKWNAHHNLAWQLQETNRYDRFEPELGSWEDLIEEIETSVAENIILSSEDFCYARPPSIVKIAEYLQPYEVNIIVYLRRQDQYLQSKWIQIAKLGKSLPTFSEWIDEELDRNQFLDYAAILDRWAKVFGTPNIIVRPFEKEVLGTGLIVDFLRLCGLEFIDWFQQTKSKNVSPSVQAMALVRKITNNLPDLSGIQVTTPEFKQLMARTRNLFDLQNVKKDKINFITNDLHQRIMSRFSVGNKEVANNFLARNELFLEPFTEKPITDLESAQLDANVLQKLEVKLLIRTFKKILENIDEEHLFAPKDQSSSTADELSKISSLVLSDSEIEKKDETKYNVIVYQMGKVGSTSIVESLSNLPEVEAYQSHFLGSENLHTMLDLALASDVHPHILKHQKGQIMKNLDLTRLVLAHLQGRMGDIKLGIVSITREPIDWFRSQIVQQAPAYLEGFATLAGLDDKELLDGASIQTALRKIKENFKQTLKQLGPPINLELSRNYRQVYTPILREQDQNADIFITHFKHFMRPFLWYPKMVSSVFDIKDEILRLNVEGFQFVKSEWGFLYLFRYEDLSTGFERLIHYLGNDNIPLSRNNISTDKIFSKEIKQAFKEWESDGELKNLIRSDYTRRFGYE